MAATCFPITLSNQQPTTPPQQKQQQQQQQSTQQQLAPATAEQPKTSEQMTVLRIKRKRTQTPLSALLIHNAKKSKVDQVSEDELKNNILFKYSGTVDAEQVDNTQQVVNDYQAIYNQLACHQKGATTEGQRDEKKRRCHDDEGPRQKLSRYRVLNEKRTASGVEVGGKTATMSKDMDKLYKVFDMIADEDPLTGHVAANEQETIMCNNVEMIKEKLNITDDEPCEGRSAQQLVEPAYVYDLYLAPGGAVMIGDNEIVNVEQYMDGGEGVYEHAALLGKEDEECYDDEDDENDEDNWRNEYPEEESDGDESWSDKSDNSDDGSEGSSDDEYGGGHVFNQYREGIGRAKFDPYAVQNDDDYTFTIESDVDSDGWDVLVYVFLFMV